MRPIDPADMDDLTTLNDASSPDSDRFYPFLIFNRNNGTIIIADDDEPSNDETARDFVLAKPDAIKLISVLLEYALYGTTSTVRCVSQFDVEDMLKAKDEHD